MSKKYLAFLAMAFLATACGGSCDDEPVTVTDSSEDMGIADQKGDFASQVQDKVFYDFDQYKLTPDSRRSLEAQAKWLMEHKEGQIEVQGYCDKRGPDQYNMVLGKRRADASAGYLVSLGVDESRVKTISFGKRVTLVPGDTEEAYAQNRVAITVVR